MWLKPGKSDGPHKTQGEELKLIKFDSVGSVNVGKKDGSSTWWLNSNIMQRWCPTPDVVVAPAPSCPNGHVMANKVCDRPGFGCDLCRGSIPSGNSCWQCRACNHDICFSCKKGPIICGRGHSMEEVPAGTVPTAYSSRSLIPRCDKCRTSSIHENGHVNHHCPQCEYDLCYSCAAGPPRVGDRGSGMPCPSAPPAPMSSKSKAKAEERVKRPQKTDPAAATAESSAESTCCVCLVDSTTHIIVPCGHMCLCETCSSKISSGSKKCPLCKANATQIIRVFK